MQGTRVRALVREDPTCREATKPVRHNYWACAPEPVLHNKGSPAMRSLRIATKSSPRSPQLEKPAHSNEDPTQPKQINKYINFKIYNDFQNVSLAVETMLGLVKILAAFSFTQQLIWNLLPNQEHKRT